MAEDTLALDPAAYWKLRYLSADAELATTQAAQAQATLAQAQRRVADAMAEAGVPAEGAWRFIDTTCTLTRVPATS